METRIIGLAGPAAKVGRTSRIFIVTAHALTHQHALPSCPRAVLAVSLWVNIAMNTRIATDTVGAVLIAVRRMTASTAPHAITAMTAWTALVIPAVPRIHYTNRIAVDPRPPDLRMNRLLVSIGTRSLALSE